jgi:methylmalonyl-CoA/ethylmalonyl-CoA epimerase
MKQFGLTFHHIGLAVREPSAARAMVEGLGYTLQSPVCDQAQNVNLIMALHPAMPDIEIIWSTGRAGPLDKMLQNHPGGLVYHLCFVAEDVQASLDAMEQAGLDAFCVSSAKAAVLFGGRMVSFYVIKGLGLIELIEGAPGAAVETPGLWADLRAS